VCGRSVLRYVMHVLHKKASFTLVTRHRNPRYCPAGSPLLTATPRLAGRDMAARACRATRNQSVREAMREFEAPDARVCVVAFCTRRRSYGHLCLFPAAPDVAVLCRVVCGAPAWSSQGGRDERPSVSIRFPAAVG
jgi:hypothetical protein